MSTRSRGICDFSLAHLPHPLVVGGWGGKEDPRARGAMHGPARYEPVEATSIALRPALPVLA